MGAGWQSCLSASMLGVVSPGRGFRDFSLVRWLGDGWGVHAKAGHSQGCPRSLRVFLIVSAQAEASAIFRWGGEAGLAVLPALVLRGDDMLRLGTRSVRGPWPPIVASFLARVCPDRGVRDLSVVRWGRVGSLVCFGAGCDDMTPDLCGFSCVWLPRPRLPRSFGGAVARCWAEASAIFRRCGGGGLAVLSVCLGAGCGDILRLGTRRDRGPWPLIFASFLACGCQSRSFHDLSVVRWGLAAVSALVLDGVTC